MSIPLNSEALKGLTDLYTVAVAVAVVWLNLPASTVGSSHHSGITTCYIHINFKPMYLAIYSTVRVLQF